MVTENKKLIKVWNCQKNSIVYPSLDTENENREKKMHRKWETEERTRNYQHVP